MANIVREDGYRILHGHTVRTALIGGMAARMAGVPMVYHAHSPASHDSTRRWADRVNGLVERLSLRRVSRVIAVSQAMAEHIAAEGFDPARITVVPNGVPSLAALPDRAAPGGWWTLGHGGPVPAAERDRGPAGCDGDSSPAGNPVHLRAVGDV